MAIRSARAKPPVIGNTPDPRAVPVGLEAWRGRANGKDYILFRFPVGDPNRWAPLTPRERAVASEVLHGLSNAEIAVRLHVAERTVANQVASIFSKLKVGSRAELACLFAKSLTRET